LYKVYGIRVLFLTSAVGRKFDIVVLLVKIGTGLGVMVIAHYLSDLICMWILPNSLYYRNKKYMNVDEQNKEIKRQQWRVFLTEEELNKAYF